MPEQEIISEYRGVASDICSGCGGYTPDGERTGNMNLKSFSLSSGRNSAFIITYCDECAAKIARFLLEAWEK